MLGRASDYLDPPLRTGKGSENMSRCCGCTRNSNGRRKVPCRGRLHPMGIIQTKNENDGTDIYSVHRNVTTSQYAVIHLKPVRAVY